MTTVVKQAKSTIHYSKYFDDTWINLENVPTKKWGIVVFMIGKRVLNA